MPQAQIILDTELFTALSDGTTLFIRPKADDVDFIRVQTPDGQGVGFSIGFNANVPYLAAPFADFAKLNVGGYNIAGDELTPIFWDGEAETLNDAIQALIEHANLSRQGPPSRLPAQSL